MALWPRSGEIGPGVGTKNFKKLHKVKTNEQFLRKEKSKLALESELAEKYASEHLGERLKTAGGGVYTRDQYERARKIGKELESTKKEKQAILAKITPSKVFDDNLSIKEMKRICCLLLDAIRGKQKKSETVLVDADRLIFSQITEVEEVPLAERSQAIAALWNFSFRGDIYRAVIVECRGIDVCIEILTSPPRHRVGSLGDLARKIFCGAIAILKSLSENRDLIPELTKAGATRIFLDLLNDRTYLDQWATVLQFLAAVSDHDKDERNRIIKQDVLMHVLGDFNQHQWCADSLIKDGRELYAVPALHLVETILTKDAIRIFVTERTRAIEILASIISDANHDTKGVACRVISRLCRADPCKVALRRAGLAQSIAAYFCKAISSINIGSAGAALGAICTDEDVQVAHDCWPQINQILTQSVAETPTRDWDFINLALPGALRAARIFAQEETIQDCLADRLHLGAILSVISRSDSSEVAKADGCHILSSISLKPKYHSLILSLNPSPLKLLFVMMKDGNTEQKASAARAVQNLSCGATARLQIANYVHIERKLVNKNTLQEVTNKWDVMDIVTGLMQSTANSACQIYGAGILRNIVGIQAVRGQILKKARSDSAIIGNLCLICRKGALEARANAAAALGILSRSEDMASIICQEKVIPELVSMSKLEFSTDHDPVAIAECQQLAMQTLGLLAYDVDAVTEMLRCKVVDALKYLLPSSSRMTRQITARTLQNLTSFPACSNAFARNGPLMNAIFTALRRRDRAIVSESLMASLANLAAHPDNLPCLINPNSSKLLVGMLRAGSAPQQACAANIMKQAACTMDRKLHEPLVLAGAIPALVRLTGDGMPTAGGAGDLAAGALARLCAADKDAAAACVHSRGLEGCLGLLKAGDATAQEQAAKCLVVLAGNEEYCRLILQMGGLSTVRDRLRGPDAEVARLCGVLADLVSTQAAAAGAHAPSTMVDRQIEARLAVLRVQAEHMRNSQQAAAPAHAPPDDLFQTAGGDRAREPVQEEGEESDEGGATVEVWRPKSGRGSGKQVTFAAASKAVAALLPPLRPP